MVMKPKKKRGWPRKSCNTHGANKIQGDSKQDNEKGGGKRAVLVFLSVAASEWIPPSS